MASRRGHGEGSIYQREDGRWCAAIDLGYVGGKRKRKVIYGKTRKDVSEKLKVVLRDHQQGLPVATERKTVERYLNEWLKNVAAPKVRPSTLQVYGEMISAIVPHIGRIELAKLTPEDVQAMLRAMSASGVAASSVARARAVLRNALGQAVRWGSLSRNVAALTDRPPESRQRPKVLSLNDAKKLLEAAQTSRLEALYHIALNLGLRQGELLGLRWQDVDLESSTLRIEQTIKAVRNKLIILPPKTRRSRRTLPLPPHIVGQLRRHKAHQLEERLLAGERWKEHGLVFASSVGTPIPPRNLVRSFGSLLARASLPHMRFHDLRHSSATLLAANGVPQRVAMEILGHTNISTTMNIYTHVFDDNVQQAIHTIGALLDTAEAS